MKKSIQQRLSKELEEVAELGKSTGVEAFLLSGTTKQVNDSGRISDENDGFPLRGTISGPRGTPYQGGTFDLSITVGSSWPFTAPHVQFDTMCYHPFIDPNVGIIGLNILKDEWSPGFSLHAILISIQAMLSNIIFPDKNGHGEALNSEALDLYETDRLLFRQRARYWSQAFAIPNTVTSICNFVGLNAARESTRHQVAESLEACDWDKVTAVMLLCSIEEENEMQHQTEQEQKGIRGSEQATGSVCNDKRTGQSGETNGPCQLQSAYSGQGEAQSKPTALLNDKGHGETYVPVPKLLKQSENNKATASEIILDESDESSLHSFVIVAVAGGAGNNPLGESSDDSSCGSSFVQLPMSSIDVIDAHGDDDTAFSEAHIDK